MFYGTNQHRRSLEVLEQADRKVAGQEDPARLGGFGKHE